MAYNHYILVCGGTGCESSGSVDIYENLKAAAKEFYKDYDPTNCKGSS